MNSTNGRCSNLFHSMDGARRRTGAGSLRFPYGRMRAQRGVALVVALILLVVITLIGLAAVSGTIMQSKMAANQYDRQTAFQNAESALRAAQSKVQAQLIANAVPAVARDCSTAGVACLANPFTDENLPAGSIVQVPLGNGAGQYSASTLATGQPEYVIEYMGQWTNRESSVGCSHNGNAQQGSGICNQGSPVNYYRITARSGDPATVGDRAVVTLQAIVEQF